MSSASFVSNHIRDSASTSAILKLFSTECVSHFNYFCIICIDLRFPLMLHVLCWRDDGNDNWPVKTCSLQRLDQTEL